MSESLSYQLAFAKKRIDELRNALDYHQREAAKRRDKELAAQLEINALLIERVIQLEDELDAIKQRDN